MQRSADYYDRKQQRFREDFLSSDYVQFIHSFGCNNENCKHGDSGWGFNPIEAEHVTTRSNGGKWYDIVPLCRNCHSNRHYGDESSIKHLHEPAYYANTWCMMQLDESGEVYMNIAGIEYSIKRVSDTSVGVMYAVYIDDLLITYIVNNQNKWIPWLDSVAYDGFDNVVDLLLCLTQNNPFQEGIIAIDDPTDLIAPGQSMDIQILESDGSVVNATITSNRNSTIFNHYVTLTTAAGATYNGLSYYLSSVNNPSGDANMSCFMC